jgi:hypothetical protein
MVGSLMSARDERMARKVLVEQPCGKLTWNQTEPGTLAGRGRTAIRTVY